RQRVVAGAPTDTFFRGLFLGDVAHRHDDAPLAAFRTQRAPAVQGDPSFGAIDRSANTESGFEAGEIAVPRFAQGILKTLAIRGMDAFLGEREAGLVVRADTQDLAQPVR